LRNPSMQRVRNHGKGQRPCESRNERSGHHQVESDNDRRQQE
jgi:hypothetical protein